MSDEIHGHVTDVTREIRGDETVTPGTHTPEDETEISVADSADFDETGGHVLVEGQVYSYTSIFEYDTGIAALLGLVPGLVVDIEDQTRVDVYDIEAGDVVSEWVATVADDLDGSAVRVAVSHALIDLVGDGIVGIVGKSAVVTRDQTGAWTLTNILGSTPEVDGSFLDPGTVPDPTIPTEPPASSPEVTAVGLSEEILLRTEPIEATTSITYQVSTDAGETWTDMPDMPVRTTIYVAKTLPNGDELVVGTLYQFRTIAGNVAGDAPPSPAAETQLDTSAVALVASELIAAQVLAGFLLVGQIAVGGNTFTLTPPNTDPDNPAGGLRIELSNGGLIHLPADGSDATITAHLTAQSLNVVNGAEISGASHLGGQIQIGATIPDPAAAPTATTTYDSIQAAVATSIAGLCRTVAEDGWIVGSGTNIYQLDETGSIVAQGSVPQATELGGVVRIAGFYYVLGKRPQPNPELGEFTWWITKHDPSTLAFVSGASFELGAPSALGTDGTDLLVQWPGGSSYQIFRVTTTGTVVGGPTNLGSSPTTLGGIYYGAADFGVTRWVLHPRTTDVQVYSTAPARVTADEWPRPASHQVRGMWWDGSNFWVINGTGLIRKLEGLDTSGTHYWSYTYVDSDTHHTGPSPQRTWPRVRRSKVRIEAPPAPQESATGTHIANRIQIYAAATVGGTKFPQGVALAVGVRSVELATIGASGTPPSANNWSGVVNPGELLADVGGFSVDGNSNGSIGTGTFRDSARTPDQDSGVLAASGSYAGTARAVRFGNFVTLVADISRASGSDSSFTATGVVLPVGMRPAAVQHFPAQSFFNSAATYRYRLQTTGELQVQMSAANTQLMVVNGTVLL